MKKIYDSLCRFFSKYGKAMIICALMVVPQLAFATGGGDQTRILNSVTTSLGGVGGDVIKLVRVIAILAGFASAIMVIVNLLKQERDSVTKAIFWALGVVASFAITAALGTALTRATNSTGGAFLINDIANNFISIA